MFNRSRHPLLPRFVAAFTASAFVSAGIAPAFAADPAPTPAAPAPAKEKAAAPEAPVLAVEVVSPDDTAEEVDAKIRSWLAAGTKLAWVLYPRGRTVTVYRSLDDIHVLTEKDQLKGDPVVPGFTCAIADLFSGIK